jgi:RhtB (resistance to homoserine/threonine) family protein
LPIGQIDQRDAAACVDSGTEEFPQLAANTILTSNGGGYVVFAEVFVVGLLAGISPGPDFVVVMRNSLGYGARVGMATAIGIGVALFIHVSYTVLGYTVILASHPQLFFTIQGVGAAYLAWLGFGALQTKVNKQSTPVMAEKSADSRSVLQGFRDGFLCNALNPKSALFFLSIFAQFLSPGMPEWIKWVYGAEVVLAVGSWFTILSWLISSEWFRQAYYRHEGTVSRLLGIALLYLAVRIAVSMVI